ncbi:pilus assembly protein N-terminal domain-containing protein [Vibrio lentus]|nr:pilus assembly protein N-terminal domain-containing protein [Vibrio lentus]
MFAFILAPLIGFTYKQTLLPPIAPSRSTMVSIQLKSPIGQVFINNPDIVDYKIINDNTIVVFANAIGQSRLIVSMALMVMFLLSDRALLLIWI